MMSYIDHHLHLKSLLIVFLLLWLCNRRSPPAICATAAPSLPRRTALAAGVRPSVPDTVDRPFSKRANSFDRTNPSRSVTLLEDSIAPPIGGRWVRNERERERVSEKDNPETDASNVELALSLDLSRSSKFARQSSGLPPSVGVGMHRPWRQ